MQILPAIDLLGGKCVRLKQGAEKTAKVYNEDPVQQARLWEEQGGEVLHIVNLDGAFGRAAENVQAIESIVNAVTCPVELGGGIRNMQDIERWLELGVTRVILGTVAITDPEIVDSAVRTYGAEKIIVGLDGRDNKVAIEGWEKQTDTGIFDSRRRDAR
ncbi:MAG: HisA/HisF-related TIM barrel protein [candidate division KSB1 bacterium]|nr:HisA/HisF-related TIM barrel protein [candidate division KSB1 bacterium]